jgi:HK97 family phage prohead protease
MSAKLEINFPITLTAADNRKRTISGTIVSWNEKGMTSAGATVFEKDSIDFSKPVKLLLEHDRTRPIGKLVDITADDAGIQATFKVAGTIAGDDSLLEAAEGLRDGFSVGVVVDDWDTNKGVMQVKASRLMEVSLVAEPAIQSARVSEIAASEQPENSEATAEEQTTNQEEKVSDTNSEAPIATEAVEAAKSEPVVVAATQPVAYTKPRSPINSQARYLEHSIKASMGNRDSAEYVAHAQAEAAKVLTAADDSFSTNPAFKPIQYVRTVVDTSIANRAAIDAIGTRRLPNSGMQVSVPKITTNGSVAETAEGNAPSETGIVSSYVDLTVKKYSGLQRYSVEILDRADPSFYDAMLENMRRAYAGATEAAVIAALTAGGAQANPQAATSDGVIAYIAEQAPAAYLGTGELATRYICGTGQWGLLLGAKDASSNGRPIYSAASPYNAAGSVSSQSLRGNVLGLDLYVSNKAVSTVIDESAFIVVPSAVAIYESPTLLLSNNVLATGEIEAMLYGYMATGVLVSEGVRRFNLT